MTNEQWRQQLRDLMSQHQEPVPDTLWSAVEERLPVHSARRPAFLWWGRAAAATAVLAIAGAAAYFALHRAQPQPSAGLPPALTAHRASQSQPVADIPSLQPTLTVRTAPKTVAPVAVTPAAVALADSLNEAAAEDYGQPLVAVRQDNPTAESSPSAEQQPQQQLAQELPPVDWWPDDAVATRRKSSSRVTLSLLAQNSFNESGNRDLTDAQYVNEYVRTDTRDVSLPLPSMSNILDNFIAQNSSNRLGWNNNSPSDFPGSASNHWMEKLDAHYYMPISFGVVGRYQLTDRFSIGSGLVYTFVRTDYILCQVYGGDFDARLYQHYIGLPLNVSYDVLRRHRWQLYGLVGGQMDVNAASESRRTGSLPTRDRLLFSAEGAVGAQYDVSRLMGIYLEPGFRYYFDNGSRVDNIFKDRPFSFRLQLGLRFNLR